MRISCYVPLALLLLPLAPQVSASPTVLDFDDIEFGQTQIPMGYRGINWASNMGVYSSYVPPWDPPQSPPNRILFNLNNEWDIAESIISFIEAPKIFVGAYFTGYLDVRFNLYSGDTLVSTSGIGLSNYEPRFLASDYTGPVDRVGIVGFRGELTMDDFTFDQILNHPLWSRLPSLRSVCLATDVGCQMVSYLWNTEVFPFPPALPYSHAAETSRNPCRPRPLHCISHLLSEADVQSVHAII
jgi:hypothetical protein